MGVRWIHNQSGRSLQRQHAFRTGCLSIQNGVVKSETKKSDTAKADEQLKQIPSDAVLVNRMIMKDNDAGPGEWQFGQDAPYCQKISHMGTQNL